MMDTLLRRTLRAFAGAAVVALALVTLPANAQVPPVEPRWVVVQDDDTALRCGDFDRFYKVATLSRGTVLRMDGQTNDWARVIYPRTLGAYVAAQDVELVDDRTVELTRPTRMRAPSELLGLSGSWRPLYSRDLRTGLRLRVIETVTGSDGEVAGYRVVTPTPPEAPEPAYGYVPLRHVRDATPTEIERHEAREARPLDEVLAGRRDAEDEAEPEEEPRERPGTERPAAERPERDAAPRRDAPAERDAPAADRSLLDPIVAPGEEAEHAEHMERRASEIEAEGRARSGADERDEGEIEAREAEPDAVEEGPGLIPASVEALEASFQAMRRLGREELDDALDEMLAEFTRTIDSLGEDDEDLAGALRSRAEWLELRIATRDQRRALADALREADEREQAIAQRVEEWRRGRAYLLVGRLVPSRVYDGERLPLMYRVQSLTPDGGTARTLGYVRPRQEDEFRNVLGRVVGITGERTFDPALGLMVVRPDGVDALPERD